jgi:hypothetical protein
MILGHIVLTGQLDEAMVLHQKEEVICQALGDKAGLSRSYGNQALILRRKGLLDEAIVLLQKQEDICQTMGLKAGLAICYWDQGIIIGE